VRAVRRYPARETMDEASLFILIIGVALAGIILGLLVRFERGIVGLLVAGVAIGLLAYWLMEIRKAAGGEIKVEIARQAGPSRKPVEPRLPQAQKPEGWTYDLIDEGEQMTLIAEVPSPTEKIKVTQSERMLQIVSGQDFDQVVELPENAEVLKATYKNRVLQIILRKTLMRGPRETPL